MVNNIENNIEEGFEFRSGMVDPSVFGVRFLTDKELKAQSELRIQQELLKEAENKKSV